MSNQQIPIACDLSALPDHDKHLSIGEELMPQAQNVAELDDGYQIEFPIDTLDLVAQFVDGERRCCPFIHFQISVPPASDTVMLSVTGREAVKKFLTQELLPHLSTIL